MTKNILPETLKLPIILWIIMKSKHWQQSCRVTAKWELVRSSIEENFWLLSPFCMVQQPLIRLIVIGESSCTVRNWDQPRHPLAVCSSNGYHVALAVFESFGIFCNFRTDLNLNFQIYKTDRFCGMGNSIWMRWYPPKFLSPFLTTHMASQLERIFQSFPSRRTWIHY